MKKNTIVPIIIFIVLLIGMSIFPYIPITIFNLDINTFSNFLKVLYSFACDLGWIIIIYIIYHKTINKDFKEYFKNFKENFSISIRYLIIGFVFMTISNFLINTFINPSLPANEDSIRTLIDMYPLYMLFSVAVYAPIAEEILFRKSIKDAVYAFKKNKFTKYLYIFISGFIFAGLHIIGSTNSYLDYLYIIPYLSLGIAFSALYAKTDNIFSTITVHSLHNLVAIILYIGVGI